MSNESGRTIRSDADFKRRANKKDRMNWALSVLAITAANHPI